MHVRNTRLFYLCRLLLDFYLHQPPQYLLRFLSPSRQSFYTSAMPVLQAKVKGVLSGDTLILTNPRGLERTLSLAYVSAPRLRREGDEVWQNPAEFLK